MSQSAEAPAKPVPLKIFISYAHEDEAYRAALDKYLGILKLQGLVEHWDDRQINAGDRWEDKISENLDRADIVVLLVSIDFVVSEYSREKEMQRALERESAGLATVVPVLVRETEGWNMVKGLGSLQALPVKPGTQPEELLPIKDWNDDDKAWGAVVRGLTRKIREHNLRITTRPPPMPAPPPTSTPAAAEASAAGVKALRGWLDDPKVRVVAEKFRADFAAASRQLVLLSDLKDLHDHLHTLQFQCVGFVVQESRRGEGGVSWENLVSPESTLRDLTEKMKAVAQRPSLAELDLAWIDELVAAYGELHAAMEGEDVKLLASSVERTGRVLAFEPLRINIQLSAAAASLPLAEIEEGMAGARRQLGEADLASVEGRQIADGVTALAELRPGVARITKEHTQWQGIDAELRRIESQLRKDTSDLEFAWGGLKKRILALCAASPGAPWASLLEAEIAKLESALAANLPSKIAQAFGRTYSQVGLRFYNVDFELLELCKKLRKVGTEIDKLLTKL